MSFVSVSHFRIMNKYFYVLLVFSASIIIDLDFDNLSGLDWALIISTVLMVAANVAAMVKKNA